MSRPPYLRWAAAAALLIGAFAWDLRGTRSEPFPFAAADIESGEPIEDAAVDWRDTPIGLMAIPDLAAPYASRSIAAGEPITRSAVATEPGIPDGWWAVPVALPTAAHAGTRVRLVLFEPVLTVDGIVVVAATDGMLTFGESGLVAVPGEFADAVGRAAAEGSLTVLVEP